MPLPARPICEIFCDDTHRSIWLTTEPMDMRTGTEKALAQVIALFGTAQPHCAYPIGDLFCC